MNNSSLQQEVIPLKLQNLSFNTHHKKWYFMYLVIISLFFQSVKLLFSWIVLKYCLILSYHMKYFNTQIIYLIMLPGTFMSLSCQPSYSCIKIRSSLGCHNIACQCGWSLCYQPTCVMIRYPEQ